MWRAVKERGGRDAVYVYIKSIDLKGKLAEMSDAQMSLFANTILNYYSGFFLWIIFYVRARALAFTQVRSYIFVYGYVLYSYHSSTSALFNSRK